MFYNFQIFYKGVFISQIKQSNSMFRDNWAQNQNKTLSPLEDPTETETTFVVEPVSRFLALFSANDDELGIITPPRLHIPLTLIIPATLQGCCCCHGNSDKKMEASVTELAYS